MAETALALDPIAPRRGEPRLGRAAWAFVLLAVCACVPPKDRRPGLRLSGEVENGPVADWSFTNPVPEIFVETKTWYWVPHSVTTACVAHNGTLYVPSLYRNGGQFPDGKFWNRNIVRDPQVRLKIGEKIYPRKATLVTDPAEFDKVFEAFARKYDLWKQMLAAPKAERPLIYFIRMDPSTSTRTV